VVCRSLQQRRRLEEEARAGGGGSVSTAAGWNLVEDTSTPLPPVLSLDLLGLGDLSLAATATPTAHPGALHSQGVAAGECPLP
jgi:hypothetical protein